MTVQSGAGTFVARKAIIAVPPTLLTRNRFTPELPQRKVALHDRLSVGSTIKFWVLYETPFWRDKD